MIQASKYVHELKSNNWTNYFWFVWVCAGGAIWTSGHRAQLARNKENIIA